MDTKRIIDKLKQRQPDILGSQSFSKFAVFIPLIKQDNQINILFEVRSEKLRRQPGEICFPGGRIDENDKTAKDAAIRETSEELGVIKKNIVDVTPIDYVVSPMGMIVYPFAGRIDNPETIEPNTEEVGEIFTVPLTYFLETKPEKHRLTLGIQPDDDFPFDLIDGGENYNWRTLEVDEYFYNYEGKVIWGLTAKIISHFAEIIQEDFNV
ncbi:NUDIX hydrolase [Aquibacillus rhizosphaerae]|uniref:CoA pyrophosphatase n=1 Tax=Aquibacillus rhizosphaerae TaxID=3051431 RepID=A0ABT7LB92_9BACI|nr:CoA pyrophosphatase [Aquibacillus sp. LR5S19]MDL4843138.1 CoA pyrophosphatase [Aquibacillus sp. LR5S19]